ncbi:MAG: FkbM family methyltransferase [Bacillota bacterium]
MAKSQLLRQVRDTWRYRQIYASLADVWHTFTLRRAASQNAAAAQQVQTTTLQLRDLPHRVTIRPGTTDFLVVHEVLERGDYAPIRQWHLPPDAIIVDLGGNIGLATLFFDQLFSRSRCTIVEPDAENRRLIRINCRHLIDSRRLEVYGAFVGARDGQASIDRRGGNWGFRKVDSVSADAEPIECISMPTLMARRGLTKIDLLKCDIEGSEVELFRTCQPWIHQVDHLVVETHDDYRLSNLYADLHTAGWEFEVLTDHQRSKTGVCFLKRVANSTHRN